MRSGRFAALTRAAVVLAVTASVSAQGPRPTFRVSSDLVVVDLLASSKDGRFVADLQPSEITILQDGKPQKVEFVRLVRAGEPDSGGRPAAPSAAENTPPPSAPSVLPPGLGTGNGPVSLAVVLDLQSTPAEALSFVKDAISKMAAELPAGSQVAIASLNDGLTVHQRMTPDIAAVRSVIQSIASPGSVTPTLAKIVEAADDLCELAASRIDTKPGYQQTLAMAKMLTIEWQKRLRLAADNLGSLATSLGAQDGRKHVVFYSSGYPLNPVHAIIDVVAAANASCAGLDVENLRRQVAEELAVYADFDAATPMQMMADRANRAQVSFYTVDSRGLVPSNVQSRQRSSARGVRGGQAAKTAQLETTLPQEFLRLTATETGGRAFLNTNDLGSGMRAAWRDASEYYLVGYTPASTPRKGKFHKIEVRVSRPELDLRYRGGYYAATDREVATREVESAMRTPDAFAHTGLEIDARTENRKLRVTAYLPPASVRFTTKDAANLGEISVHATLRDANGKLVGGKPLFGKDISLRFSAEQIDGMRRSDNVEVPVDVDAPKPGTYVLTVVARASGGWVGARTMAVAVSSGS